MRAALSTSSPAFKKLLYTYSIYREPVGLPYIDQSLSVRLSKTSFIYKKKKWFSFV